MRGNMIYIIVFSLIMRLYLNMIWLNFNQLMSYKHHFKRRSTAAYTLPKHICKASMFLTLSVKPIDSRVESSFLYFYSKFCCGTCVKGFCIGAEFHIGLNPGLKSELNMGLLNAGLANGLLNALGWLFCCC